MNTQINLYFTVYQAIIQSLSEKGVYYGKQING